MSVSVLHWVLLVIAFLSWSSSCQNLAITYQQPSTCASSQIYDTVQLACASCPQGFFPTTDQASCATCDHTSGKFYDFELGLAIYQSWLPTTASGAGQCSCATVPGNAPSVVAAAFFNGTVVNRCVLCPSGTSVVNGNACGPVNGSTSVQDLDKLIRAIGSAGGQTTSSTAATQARGGTRVPIGPLLVMR